MKNCLAALLLLLGLCSTLPALENPGFEEGDKGWNLSDGMSSVQKDAANEGTKGLRVVDQSETAGSNALSSPVKVEPGADVELHFQAKTDAPSSAGVYLWFYDAGGKIINDPAQRAGQGHPVVGINAKDTQWNEYTLKTKAPENAASVSIWIHSFGKATGTTDYDDFSLIGTGEAAPTPPPTPTPTPIALPKRDKPPIIIVKVDDLRMIDGKVNGLWVRLADYLKARHIKCSIGIICQTLADATPQYAEWIKDRQASGDIEFWFHGWDHGTHDVGGGKQANEFVGRSYEEQKKRFDDSQALAKEKLGFPFATFGPPGGVGGISHDENTIRVMQDDPNMKVWLYPQPLDEAGKKLEEKGKVTILDRVWDVNFESSVGHPDFQKFLAGYAKNPSREYFVLQGHPMHWGNPAQWNEFTKIIDFLVEQKAVFMTPSELAATLAKEKAH